MAARLRLHGAAPALAAQTPHINRQAIRPMKTKGPVAMTGPDAATKTQLASQYFL
jgi:hypothetical protein